MSWKFMKPSRYNKNVLENALKLKKKSWKSWKSSFLCSFVDFL